MIRIWRAFAAASGLVVAALLVAGLVLGASGAVTAERLQDAARVLRDGLPPPPPPPAEPPRVVDDGARRQAAEAMARREEDLRRLEGRVAARQAQADAERLRLVEEAARLKEDRERQDVGGIDADLAANVPILSKMDGASIVTALRGADNATFVRYLRALRPGKAAEVLDALQNDPTFEQEFRRPAAGAPRGARTRADLLMEEFRKAPQG
jgi:hypothetical protein